MGESRRSRRAAISLSETRSSKALKSLWSHSNRPGVYTAVLVRRTGDPDLHSDFKVDKGSLTSLQDNGLFIHNDRKWPLLSLKCKSAVGHARDSAEEPCRSTGSTLIATESALSSSESALPSAEPRLILGNNGYRSSECAAFQAFTNNHNLGVRRSAPPVPGLTSP